MQLQDFLTRLEKVTGHDGQYASLCPAHEDTTASLCIASGRDGRILLKCQAGCPNVDIVSAVGLTMKDLFPDQPASGERPVKEATYTYCDKTSRPILRKVKLRYPDGKKSFYWQHKAAGGWQKGTNGIKVPLYNRPMLAAQGTVYFVEGEKDADTLTRQGLIAVSSPHGAGGKTKWEAAFTDCLAGRDVVILPDNDKTGADFAAEVADALTGTAATLKLIDLTAAWPALKPHSDITDVFESERNDRAVLDRLAALVAETPEYTPSPSRRAEGLAFINPIDPPSVMSRYTLDDIGTARLFADTFQGRMLFLPEYKSWFVYDGGVWKQDTENLIAHGMAIELADHVRDVIPSPPSDAPADGLKQNPDPWAKHRKHYGKYRGLGCRNVLITDSRSMMHATSKDFDRQPYLFNCMNGTLDLQTGQLRPHDPADRLAKQAVVEYRPGTRCERFERFIDEITEGNRDRALMLQRALGYCLKGDANEECFFLASGEKTRNGKGTLFDTMMQLFGSYGAQIDFDTISKAGARDASRPTPDIARLIGLRFVLSNEPDKGVYINEALLKQLTGNDDITARPMYGNNIQFKPVFKLFITANSKPNVSDDSLFASDRVKVLPFTRHFSEDERDTTLKAQLRTP